MMVLDLNLAFSGETPPLPEKSLPDENSGTSKSSVLNAEASSNTPDEDSCSTRPVAGFQFGILKSSTSAEGENEVEVEIEEDGNDASLESSFVTRQLFPSASPVVPEWPQPPLVAASSSQRRVDLSFCLSDIPAVKVLQLQQAAAAATQEVSQVPSLSATSVLQPDSPTKRLVEPPPQESLPTAEALSQTTVQPQPKLVLQLMDVGGLTISHVKSHLQKLAMQPRNQQDSHLPVLL